MEERKKIHLNVPQLLFYLVQCSINVCIWGRGTGKSEGPISLFSHDNVHRMPRGNGVFLGKTYEQLLTRTLPPVIKGWEKLGYREEVHFWVRKFPARKLKIKRAYVAPVDATHYITWYNGSGIYLGSLDRPGTLNGLSVDWLAADEARFLNRERLETDVLPILRGNAEHFGKLSCHGSILFTTDRPRDAKSAWLNEYARLMDPELIETILAVQVKLLRLKEELLTAKANNQVKAQERLSRLMDRYLADLNELRTGAVYFSTASTLDNVHALGLNAIKNLKRVLSDLVYRASVLNHEVNKIDDGFYGLLDEEVHGYDAPNYDFIDGLQLNFREEVKKDCRWDTDLNPLQPLDFAADYNAAINSMVIGQRQVGPVRNKYRFLNALYVKHPHRLKDLAQEFIRYYRYHPTKEVNYYYDHTAVGTNASSDISYADEWVSILQAAGWQVNRHYIGQASSHHSRYLLWQLGFSGDPRVDEFSYNRGNCHQWQVSCENAPVKQTNGSFGKDKGSEKDPSVKPEDATHFSEAGDNLWWGTQRYRLNQTEGAFVDNLYG
ncbi:hypothetical protein SAMN05421823_102528 [Catalinimonas alkaloidigena]|uniref:Uncharacterized protein n=1 Tax=Catalinimonas alkaloidigena TaxID=1075417 RepID=A0A1G9B7N1_9BACT|nr:hypothetical protein [Catalinimonas alkaloidigena]SDK35104.1 hypothetical protein SAMN05421823_102528 [Catalinimonas alkaloidigena]